VTDVAMRAATPADEPALVALAAEAMAPQIATAGATFDAPRVVRTIEADTVFVAEVDGHTAGFVSVTARGDCLCVEHLAVALEHQGRGVGHRLLDWVEGYASSLALARVRIDVEPDNRPALDFYARRGYVAAAGGAVERDVPHVEV
jgi:GNAT superfamily N-acetyltransferase